MQYLFGNQAWIKEKKSEIIKPVCKREKSLECNKASQQSFTSEIPNYNYSSLKSIETQNQFWTTKQSDGQSSISKFDSINWNNSRMRNGSNTLFDKQKTEVVQHPFKGIYNPIDVISDPTLFRKTRQKYNIKFCLTKPNEGIGRSREIIETSFGSGFVNLANLKQRDYLDSRYESTNKNEFDTRTTLRNANSHIIEIVDKVTPKGIIKKPQTANQNGCFSSVGIRLRNKYSTAFNYKNASTNRDKDCPTNKNVKFSSYFKSCKSVPMIKIFQNKNSKESIFNQKFNGSMMPKNYKQVLINA